LGVLPPKWVYGWRITIKIVVVVIPVLVFFILVEDIQIGGYVGGINDIQAVRSQTF
jgi:hypothetical protein